MSRINFSALAASLGMDVSGFTGPLGTAKRTGTDFGASVKQWSSSAGDSVDALRTKFERSMAEITRASGMVDKALAQNRKEWADIESAWRSQMNEVDKASAAVDRHVEAVKRDIAATDALQKKIEAEAYFGHQSSEDLASRLELRNALLHQHLANSSSQFASTSTGLMDTVGNYISGIAGAIDDATGNVFSSVAGKAKEVGSSLLSKAGLSGGAALGGGLLAAAGIGLNEMMEAQDVAVQLEATLKSLGGVAGWTAASMQELASEVAMGTRFESAAVVEAETILARFKNITNDTFENTIHVSADMAQALKQSLPEAASTIGRALQDPENAYKRLAKQGIILTDAQKKQIASFMRLGELGKAQQVILDELSTRYGGSAAAATETLSGKMSKLWKTVKDGLQEIVEKGEPAFDAIIDAAQFMAEEVLGAFSMVADGWGKLTDWIVRGTLEIRHEWNIWTGDTEEAASIEKKMAEFDKKAYDRQQKENKVQELKDAGLIDEDGNPTAKGKSLGVGRNGKMSKGMSRGKAIVDDEDGGSSGGGDGSGGGGSGRGSSSDNVDYGRNPEKFRQKVIKDRQREITDKDNEVQAARIRIEEGYGTEEDRKLINPEPDDAASIEKRERQKALDEHNKKVHDARVRMQAGVAKAGDREMIADAEAGVQPGQKRPLKPVVQPWQRINDSFTAQAVDESMGGGMNKMSRSQQVNLFQNMHGQIADALKPDEISGKIDVDRVRVALQNFEDVVKHMPGVSGEAFTRIQKQVRDAANAVIQSGGIMRESFQKDFEALSGRADSTIATRGPTKFLDADTLAASAPAKEKGIAAARAQATKNQLSGFDGQTLRSMTAEEGRGVYEEFQSKLSAAFKPDEAGGVDMAAVRDVVAEYKNLFGQLGTFTESEWAKVETAVNTSLAKMEKAAPAARAILARRAEQAVAGGKDKVIAGDRADKAFANAGAATDRDVRKFVAEQRSKLTKEGRAAMTDMGASREQVAQLNELRDAAVNATEAIIGKHGDARQAAIEAAEKAQRAYDEAYKKIKDAADKNLDGVVDANEKAAAKTKSATEKAQADKEERKAKIAANKAAGPGPSPLDQVGQMSNQLSSMFTGAIGNMGAGQAQFAEYVNTITDPLQKIDLAMQAAQARLGVATINAGNFGSGMNQVESVKAEIADLQKRKQKILKDQAEEESRLEDLRMETMRRRQAQKKADELEAERERMTQVAAIIGDRASAMVTYNIYGVHDDRTLVQQIEKENKRLGVNVSGRPGINSNTNKNR